MIAFRQLILPGDEGKDVKAVKRAMKAMHAKGVQALVIDDHAGSTFVEILDSILVAHGERADGKYGPDAHAIIAPHFDAYGKALYKTAAIRSRVVPPQNLDGVSAAKRLLGHAARGWFRDDRGTELVQLRAAAAGQAVWSPAGRYVHLDRRWMDALLVLIEEHDLKIGTFAMCSDHHYDSLRGHAGGLAVDISSIDGMSVVSSGAGPIVKKTLTILRGLSSPLTPWQLISGGYGGHYDYACRSLCVPSAGFYGEPTLSQHENHVHLGYAPAR